MVGRGELFGPQRFYPFITYLNLKKSPTPSTGIGYEYVKSPLYGDKLRLRIRVKVWIRVLIKVRGKAKGVAFDL